MGFRIVLVSNTAKLNITNRRLHIIGHDREESIPVEDLDVLVIESQQSMLTSRVLSDLATEKVAIFICNERHMPNGILIPFQEHSRQLEVLKAQIHRKESFNKRCWQEIIQQKIYNQALCLKILGRSNEHLIAICKRVKSGDTDNRESVAAAWYFKHLTDEYFKRHNEDHINNKLDYGYSIIRGAISRSLASYGFIPSIGVHHESELNAFNLSDDFLEVYRPMVDLLVFKELNERNSFDKLDRARLISILNENVYINGKLQRLSYSIDIMTESYKKALLSENFTELKLPELVELGDSKYEE